MNTWREIGPMAKEPVRFTCPDGKMMGLSDTGLALEWECVERVFRIYLHGLRYGWRHAYRGRALPRDARQWKEKRYEIPLSREILDGIGPEGLRLLRAQCLAISRPSPAELELIRLIDRRLEAGARGRTGVGDRYYWTLTTRDLRQVPP